MHDYTKHLPGLLLLAGGMLQYLRAQRSIPDHWIIPAGSLLALAAYLLTAQWNSFGADPQGFILTTLEGAAAAISTLFGATFMTSKGAVGAVMLGANPDHALVPLTDSKGG